MLVHEFQLPSGTVQRTAVERHIETGKADRVNVREVQRAGHLYFQERRISRVLQRSLQRTRRRQWSDAHVCRSGCQRFCVARCRGENSSGRRFHCREMQTILRGTFFFHVYLHRSFMKRLCVFLLYACP